MELNGTIQPKGSLYGSFDFDQADYNLLKNKPSINGVTLVGNKTSEDLHIESGGGGGGTNNYNNLENKPKINNVILQDELSLHSLGIQPEIEFSGESTEYLNGNGDFSTPPGYIPINYDTEEQDTQIKWYDGRHIYTKTYHITGITGSSVFISLNDIQCDKCIDVKGNIKLGAAGANQWVSTPFIEQPNYGANIQWQESNNSIQLTSNWQLTEAIFTIWYVKQ